MKSIITSAILVSLLGACSSKPPKDPGKSSPPKMPKIVGSADEAGTSFDAKQLANEMESNYVTEIRFKKDSAELTPEAKKSLSSVIKQAKQGESLKRAKLISWADQEMPSEKKGELSDEQVELANRRNDALMSFIKTSERSVEIDPISMAERPHGFNDVIPSETKQIQESLEETGVGPGKASRAIIIFTRE